MAYEGHVYVDQEFNQLNNNNRLNLSQINENVGAVNHLSPNNANSVNYLTRQHPSDRLQPSTFKDQHDLLRNNPVNLSNVGLNQLHADHDDHNN